MSNVTQFKTKETNELELMVEEYRLIDRELKALQAKADDMKKSITSRMGSSSEVKNSLGHVIATWRECIRESLDTKAFKSSHADLFAKFCRVTVYRTFSLK